jgi:hypothetical protein
MLLCEEAKPNLVSSLAQLLGSVAPGLVAQHEAGEPWRSGRRWSVYSSTSVVRSVGERVEEDVAEVMR